MEALGRGHLFLTAAARAETLTHTVGTAPIRVLLDRAEIRVVEVLKTKTAILLAAGDLQGFLERSPPLFVFY